MKRITVGTHDGRSHGDEVTFVAIISIAILAEWGPSTVIEIIRSRDPQVLEKCDYVGDVGKVYNHELRRYDHHQTGGACAPRRNGIPFAAAGLAWLHYAEDCVRAILGDKGPWDSASVLRIARVVDERLIQGIDAMDVKAVSRPMAVANGTRVPVETGSLSSALSAFNPNPDFDDCSEEAQLALFREAVKVATRQLEKVVKEAASREKWVDLVDAADQGDPILVLSEPWLGSNAPWSEAVRVRAHVLFVVFPTIEGVWRVKAVNRRSFANGSPVLLPSAWSGLENEELQQVSGVPDASFCADGCWMAGAFSREGALALARIALAAGTESPSSSVVQGELRFPQEEEFAESA